MKGRSENVNELSTIDSVETVSLDRKKKRRVNTCRHDDSGEKDEKESLR